jgi:hypothetical protein
LDEEEETYHIEYFQGYGQFREVGLPQELPAELEEAILQREELTSLRAHIARCGKGESTEDVNFYKNEYRKTLTSIRQSELHRYQTQWVRERRDQRILSRGKNPHESLQSDACTRALTLIMPEVRYIAETLCSAEPLTHDQKLLFGSQLLTQCRRDYDVVYLPGESPIDGHCPVDTCQHNIQE